MEHNTTQMIHIGKIIETELHRQDRPVTWFANKLYCDMVEMGIALSVSRGIRLEETPDE